MKDTKPGARSEVERRALERRELAAEASALSLRLLRLARELAEPEGARPPKRAA